MKNKFPMLLLIAVFFLSCDKKEDDPKAEDPKTVLITASAWRYENSGVDFPINGTIDAPLPFPLPPCATDNFLTLSANGTGTIDEGPTKCDPLVPQSTPATWSFASNQTVLNLGGSGFFGITGQFKILELSATKLHLSKDTTAAGLPVAIIIQLKH
jgi:hypothetical protein